jgi:hypothetical protein
MKNNNDSLIKKFKNKIPLGNNKLSSMSIFFQRNVYKNLNEVKSNDKNIIDLWSEKMFYGRENEEQQSVFLNTEFLKRILPEEVSLSKKPLFAINFVVDQFHEFRDFYLNNSGCPDISVISPELIPTNAYKNVDLMYRNYINKLYDGFFNKYLKIYKKQNNLTNFESFVNLFLDYLYEIGKSIPITKTKFIASRFSSPHISGLMIEVANEKHDDDFIKYSIYIKDEKFYFFRNAAMRYGFYLDLNAPWRLISNVNSPVTKEYMKKYGINNYKEMFSKFYNKSIFFDIEVLSLILWNFYNSYVTDFPFIKEGDKEIRRIKFSSEELNNLDSSFWFSFLLKVKFIEEKYIKISDLDLNGYVKKSISIEKYFDFQRVIEYIDSLVK